MRLTIAITALCFTFAVAPTTAVHAEHFCGFKDAKGAPVRCGYITETQCKQSNGGKLAVCMPDPEFAERRAVLSVAG
jgi:hypothetical protein